MNYGWIWFLDGYGFGLAIRTGHANTHCDFCAGVVSYWPNTFRPGQCLFTCALTPVGQQTLAFNQVSWETPKDTGVPSELLKRSSFS